MDSTFTHEFEELALLRDPSGLCAVYATGRAEIAYDDEFTWSVESITLDGFGFVGGEIEREPIELKPGTIWWAHVHAAILAQSETIDERVAEELADDGVRVRGAYREHALGAFELVGRR